jgi:peptide/nickel transport system substrate-binding protein
MAVADALRRCGALLACTIVLGSAGCSRVGSQTGPSSGANPGLVRIIGIGSIDSLIPELSGNASASDIGWFWAAWLFRVDAHGQLVPELATEVPTLRNGGISKDGLSITYHLRTGVTWSDGAPFDARDVIFTWHAIMNPRNDVLTRSGYDDIASMTAPDPHTLVVRLRHAYAPAIATFFAPSLSPMCILPAHLLARLPDINRAAYDRQPVGTGPYILTHYDTDTEVDLKANPAYWRGPPKIPEVRFIISPDPNTRVLQMRSGDADVYYQLGDNLVSQLENVPGVHIVDVQFNEFWYIAYQTKHPPLDDERVRRALSMGIDRNFVVKAIANGGGSPAVGDQPPYSYAYDPHAKAPPYDPAAAAKLLDAAGWRVGADGYRYRNGQKLSLEYVTSVGYAEGIKFAPVFQADMRRLGVDIEVKTYPTSLLFAAKGAGGIVNNGKFDVLWTGWIGGVDPDDDTLWACDQMPPQGYNLSQYCDPRIDAQERIALTSYDPDVRRAAYWRIQSLLDEDVPVDFLFWTHLHDAVRDDLQGYAPAPAVTSFSNPWEWHY